MSLSAYINLDRRGAERYNVNLEAGVRRLGTPGRLVQVADLSTSGCSFEPAGCVQPGQTIFVRLPGLESLSARVIWMGVGRASCKFDRPLHAAVAARLVGASQNGNHASSAPAALRLVPPRPPGARTRG